MENRFIFHRGGARRTHAHTQYLRLPNRNRAEFILKLNNCICLIINLKPFNCNPDGWRRISLTFFPHSNSIRLRVFDIFGNGSEWALYEYLLKLFAQVPDLLESKLSRKYYQTMHTQTHTLSNRVTMCTRPRNNKIRLRIGCFSVYSTFLYTLENFHRAEYLQKPHICNRKKLLWLALWLAFIKSRSQVIVSDTIYGVHCIRNWIGDEIFGRALIPRCILFGRACDKVNGIKITVETAKRGRQFQLTRSNTVKPHAIFSRWKWRANLPFAFSTPIFRF